jgi:hypothetical protein
MAFNWLIRYVAIDFAIKHPGISGNEYSLDRLDGFAEIGLSRIVIKDNDRG